MKLSGHEVKVTQRKNCRRLILRYRPEEGRFALSAPKGTPQRAIRAFLAQNEAWMDRQAGSAAPWQPVFAAGEQHLLFSRWVTLGQDVPCGEDFCRLREKLLRETILRLLQRWTARMGVNVTHVSLREMSSRWGSCRPKTGRLTFNLHLARYEEALIEETVVHELCHFFHSDHSAAFYREMDRWLPDWRARKAARTRLDARPRRPD